MQKYKTQKNTRKEKPKKLKQSAKKATYRYLISNCMAWQIKKMDIIETKSFQPLIFIRKGHIEGRKVIVFAEQIWIRL